MSGVLLGFSRVLCGCTTRFIARRHIMLFRRLLNYQQQQQQENQAQQIMLAK